MIAASSSLNFRDGKAPEALRTIGEVSDALGIRQHVLRYWEEQFPMLRPLKRSGGRRYYRPEDIALIARIDQLVHREGYTLRGAVQALNGRTTKSITVSVAARTDSDVLAQLQTIRAKLATALAISAS